MILNNSPLTMAEALELMKKSESETSEIEGFVGKFNSLTAKDALELKKKLEELELIQLNEEQIIKLIDLMPENTEDLTKIFIGVGIGEDDTKKILELIKQFKK